MNRILKLLGTTFVVAFAIGIVLSVIGVLLKWNPITQFRLVFFWTGAILIVSGILSVMMEFKMSTDFGARYSQTAGNMNVLERSKRWIVDTIQEHGFFIFIFLTGTYFLVFAFLISLC